jgi:hypothetical protein
MTRIYFARDNSYAKELIQVLLDHLGLRLPVRHTQQAVIICNAKLGRYLKFGVSECGCAVLVADTGGEIRTK